jgi:hypothetical protein
MSGNKHPLYGKNHSPETLSKMRDATVHTFQHKDGSIETCTQNELRTKYGLNPGSLSSVVSGKLKSTGKWRLVIS